MTWYSTLLTYIPFCPVHWPWCRLSILYVMCTFEVDWSWVALLSKLMDTLTANIYRMRQVRSAKYSTHLDGFGWMAFAASSNQKLRMRKQPALSYYLIKSVEHNREKFLVKNILSIMNTRSYMPLKTILNNNSLYIHEYNFFPFRFHQFWWELESIRIYRMRGSSAFDCKLSMKLRGTPLRRINKILKLTAAENDEKIIQFYARLYTPHCR